MLFCYKYHTILIDEQAILQFRQGIYPQTMG